MRQALACQVDFRRQLGSPAQQQQQQGAGSNQLVPMVATKKKIQIN